MFAMSTTSSVSAVAGGRRGSKNVIVVTLFCLFEFRAKADAGGKSMFNHAIACMSNVGSCGGSVKWASIETCVAGHHTSKANNSD